jgi:hypothetical protein
MRWTGQLVIDARKIAPKLSKPMPTDSSTKRRKRTKKKGDRFISRQRRWQLKQQKEGSCIICGEPRKTYAQHCDECHERISPGETWVPGKPGRPPDSARGKNLKVV